MWGDSGAKFRGRTNNHDVKDDDLGKDYDEEDDRDNNYVDINKTLNLGLP